MDWVSERLTVVVVLLLLGIDVVGCDGAVVDVDGVLGTRIR